MTVATQEPVTEPGTQPRRVAEPVIELRGLSLAYESHRVFDGLDLAVTPGQVYGLIGPSGGGKTTVLRATLGLLRPTGGEALLFGRPAISLPPALRSRIGYVPQ